MLFNPLAAKHIGLPADIISGLNRIATFRKRDSSIDPPALEDVQIDRWTDDGGSSRIAFHAESGAPVVMG